MPDPIITIGQHVAAHIAAACLLLAWCCASLAAIETTLRIIRRKTHTHH
jgi:hypothetical protein